MLWYWPLQEERIGTATRKKKWNLQKFRWRAWNLAVFGSMHGNQSAVEKIVFSKLCRTKHAACFEQNSSVFSHWMQHTIPTAQSATLACKTDNLSFEDVFQHTKLTNQSSPSALTYLFFISLISRFNCGSSVLLVCDVRVTGDVITTVWGRDVVVGVVRIWYVCMSPDAAVASKCRRVRKLRDVKM